MKKRFIFLLICVFNLCSFPKASADIGADKAAHTAVSLAISTISYNLYKEKTNLTDSQQRWAAFLTTLAIGLIKELIDDPFDWEDMGFNALGAGSGAAIGFEF